MILLAALAALAVMPARAATPASDPARLGFDPAALARFDADIASGRYGHVDGLLILRHGRTVFDRGYPQDYAAIYGAQAKTAQPLNSLDPGGPYDYFNPWWHPFYRGDGRLHSLQSVTKSLVSVIVGAAVTRGDFPSLDTPVLDFFDAKTVANLDDRKRRMMLRHLLDMTTGEAWNDDVPYNDPRNTTTQMEHAFDWQKVFIDAPMAEEPGARFYYNDGAPQTLAYVFRKATGVDIETYAAKHLFAPLGIDSWFWKRTPSGVPDGEGGLYLDRHDLAKVIQLFAAGGVWGGKRILGADWVKASMTPQVKVEKQPGVSYGRLWWFIPYGPADKRLVFGGAGFGGQFPLLLKDEDVVVVVNQWNLLDGPYLKREELVARVRAALVHPDR